ncbi:MAG: 30S ribosomal protein S16 [Candidatus Dasytiphilus stammeri]
MVRIRLSRHGAKNRPFYQVIVTDKRNARNGRFIERIGFFNPIAKGQDKGLYLNLDRLGYWINQGALLSLRVNTLINTLRKQSLTLG